MTEKRGGSDVSGSTETIATPLENDTGYYSIAGNKWFSSACDRYVLKSSVKNKSIVSNIQ